jgi:hypothetical protein
MEAHPGFVQEEAQKRVTIPNIAIYLPECIDVSDLI